MDIVKKIKSDGNTMKGLSSAIETVMTENLREGFPGAWNRETAAERCITGLRSLLDGKKIVFPGNTLRTRLWAFRYGAEGDDLTCDIAVLVRLAYHDGHRAEGALLMQTALREPGKNGFSGFRKDHLKKIHSLSPLAWLMLCDYEPVAGMAFPAAAEYVIGSHPQGWGGWISYTHCALVQSGLALELGSRTTDLYKAAVPLSHQFCYRYLLGLDLDYHRLARDVARGARKERGLARYLLLASVAMGGAAGDGEDDFEINRELYSPM